MQAITTKYHGATNTRGSRISATSSGGSRVYGGYDDALSATANHARAAEARARKLDWHGEYVGGHTREGMVWVDIHPFTDAQFSV